MEIRVKLTEEALKELCNKCSNFVSIEEANSLIWQYLDKLHVFKDVKKLVENDVDLLKFFSSWFFTLFNAMYIYFPDVDVLQLDNNIGILGIFNIIIPSLQKLGVTYYTLIIPRIWNHVCKEFDFCKKAMIFGIVHEEIHAFINYIHYIRYVNGVLAKILSQVKIEERLVNEITSRIIELLYPSKYMEIYNAIEKLWQNVKNYLDYVHSKVTKVSEIELLTLLTKDYTLGKKNLAIFNISTRKLIFI